jgi:transcription factor SFP1
MRDFSCCGQTLATLHNLLQHYEECHAQQTPQSLRAASAAQSARENQQPNSKAAIAAQAATSVQQQARQQQHQQAGRPQSSGIKLGQTAQGISSLTGGIQQMRQQQQNQPQTPTPQKTQQADDMEGVEDMEMDDPLSNMDPDVEPSTAVNQRVGQQAQQMFGQRPALNLTNTSGMIHQGLRTSQPSTPSVAGFGFQNNPTVSSVNTPTLSAQPLQGQNTFSPDNSIPGTPAEMEDDISGLMMNNMTMGNMNLNMANLGNMNFNNFGFGGDLGLDLCIDEPAKRLYSPNGGFGTNQRALQQQFAQFGLANNQFNGMNGNEELMRRFRQQQMMQMQGGMGNGGMMMAGEEHKPFRCPVIGCEKAYKNQNGLK